MRLCTYRDKLVPTLQPFPSVLFTKCRTEGVAGLSMHSQAAWDGVESQLSLPVWHEARRSSVPSLVRGLAMLQQQLLWPSLLPRYFVRVLVFVVTDD